MITFLLFDHIGGINTLFYILSNGGCAITLATRSPQTVCEAIEKYKAQVLPTSPTFINLLLLSEVAGHYDLSCLELISYGTEVMPEATLKRATQTFPSVRFLQMYGLSELGILRSKSRASDSLWVKIGGEGFETRIANGLLEIKAQSAMLGYLNAPSPLTEDGWLKTGDAVEVDGEYIKILGRQSEIINVGGEKVYPAEVENVLAQLEGVVDVVVHGESNVLTGQMVVAEVALSTAEAAPDFKRRLRSFCNGLLKNYQIPQKIVIVDHDLHSARFKKSRKFTGTED
jgi:acyl-CoA synthetase (AMP-forming)/AMP-acid ligase II